MSTVEDLENLVTKYVTKYPVPTTFKILKITKKLEMIFFKKISNCKRTFFKKFFPIFHFSKIWKFGVLHLKTVIQKNEIYEDYIKNFLNIWFKSLG